ncbi:MAG: Hsp20/alpha crystallin family protein [Caldilineaceae bacterium]|nr:Hsp20/alpha crystallin family protein [Caldilineaceae bacterium]
MRVRTYSNLAQDAATLSNLMNRFFNNASYDYSSYGGSNAAPNGGSTEQPYEQGTLLPVDVWATPEAFQVNAYLPGINPEDVEITFEADELTIRGTLPAAPEGAEFIKRELYHGSFSRRLSFNVPVNADAIEAEFHNGLLTLIVPKAEAVKPKQIKIQTK